VRYSAVGFDFHIVNQAYVASHNIWLRLTRRAVFLIEFSVFCSGGYKIRTFVRRNLRATEPGDGPAFGRPIVRVNLRSTRLCAARGGPSSRVQPTAYAILSNLRFGIRLAAIDPRIGHESEKGYVMKTCCVTIAIALFCVGCTTTPGYVSNSNLVEPLRPYVREVVASLKEVSSDRKALLDQVAATAFELLSNGRDANLTFICTHNSRRSHMSQIWAQTAACYYRLEHVYAFSGGTETTACNCRTVSVMRRAGFSIVKTTEGGNPIYLIQYSDNHPTIRAYSKLYNADGNPKQGFIALMTCSHADKKCPVVEGAIARYAIHYVDPKLCDDTPDEPAAYNERCREIAREMFYIMSQTRNRADGRAMKP
jgi:arsenate reductase